MQRTHLVVAEKVLCIGGHFLVNFGVGRIGRCCGDVDEEYLDARQHCGEPVFHVELPLVLRD